MRGGDFCAGLIASASLLIIRTASIIVLCAIVYTIIVDVHQDQWEPNISVSVCLFPHEKIYVRNDTLLR